MIFPIMLLLGGAAALILLATTNFPDREIKDIKPDVPPDAPAPVGFPKSTGYKLIDKILDTLKAVADKTGIPLGLLVGWIAKESGGRLNDVTKLDERGYFQLMPDESKKLGLDHQRLSVDSTYSINAGISLIGGYMKFVDKLGIAQKGTAYYWRLVKLAHSMGSGAVQKIVDAAKKANAVASWSDLEQYALDHDHELLSATKHSPAKWFPFVDAVMRVGAPFGIGSGGDAVVGAAFNDIVDPLDYLTR